jgi:23S rRNA pseudouridine1911/1915/1917 synthase
MATEKAYKLLAAQEGISNSKAKDLIDRGLVKVGNRKVQVARGEVDTHTKFRVEKLDHIEVIYENDEMIVINKPPFVSSEEIERAFDGATLLHRLDKETSGVMILTKDEDFRRKAIGEFKRDRVYKEYVAWVEGVVLEEMDINKPILTIKGKTAKSKIDKYGKPARTEVFPILATRKRSKVKLIIHQGRTHQIRCHLRSIGHSIVGDTLYGGFESDRVMLHSKKIELLGKKFEVKEPGIFKKFE